VLALDGREPVVEIGGPAVDAILPRAGEDEREHGCDRGTRDHWRCKVP
jgi:hypothetical protein